MEATVTINSRGVVTLPAKLRQALGLKPDDQLIAETTPGDLLLHPAVTPPLEIHTAERERGFDEAALAEVLAVRAARGSGEPARPRGPPLSAGGGGRERVARGCAAFSTPTSSSRQRKATVPSGSCCTC